MSNNASLSSLLYWVALEWDSTKKCYTYCSCMIFSQKREFQKLFFSAVVGYN